MSDKRYIPLQISDIASRLNLIQRVRGLEQAETYFNTIALEQRGFDVYIALLSCYARENSVEKAESVMQQLRDLGYATNPIGYNVLMNVHYRMGNWQKIDALMNEMEEKGIGHDKFTLSIRLSAYVAASDIEGVDKIMGLLESDPRIDCGCDIYSVAANGYIKLGQVEKAMTMLKKLERLIKFNKRPGMAFHLLLKLYAKTGNKDELYRFWNLYKLKAKIYNKGYICMMSSLIEFKDIEGAEKILEEWESAGLSYDFWVPNFLIDAYCRNGHLDKAKALIYKGISKGGTPTVQTWYYLANGYLMDNQVPKAVEALVKAITVDTHRLDSKMMKDKLVTCLEYLEGKGDVDQVDEFISSLRAEGLFSTSVHDKLLNYIADNIKGNPSSQTSEVSTDCDIYALKT